MVAAIYVVEDHATVAVFLVIRRVILLILLVHLVISDIPPLRVHLAGVNAGPIIQGTVLLRATPAGVVVRQQVPKILLRPVFKRF